MSDRRIKAYNTSSGTGCPARNEASWLFGSTIFTALLVSILAVACTPQVGSGTSEITPTPTHEVAVSEDVTETLALSATVQVLISLTAPDPFVQIKGQLFQIAEAQNRVLEQVPDADFSLVYQYQTTPALVGDVNAQGLAALRAHPDVQTVTLDTSDPDELVESGILIRAYEAWQTFGLTGKGVNIAVLDTGVDTKHPDLSESIVGQHCFVACANGDPGNAQDDNGHGTHVAGIIASRGHVSPRGIAPEAGLVVVRVMDTMARDRAQDVADGIDWVVANQARLNVRIINLGMHRGPYSGVCDRDVDPRLVDAVRRAQQAGMIVVAPAGNGALVDEIAAPACVSGVLAVGMTSKRGQPNPASNSGSELDLLAPGERIRSTALDGGQTTLNGTSHAAPHVAAVAALMLQANPSLSAADVERILEETGVSVTDSRTQRSTPRVDVFSALDRVVNRE